MSMKKWRLIFIQTLMISTGILFGVGVQALVGHLQTGSETLSWQWYIPLSIIFTGFLCSLATLLLMQLGRAVLSLFFGTGPAEALRFFTTDSLSAVFTLVIIWIVRRLDGVYEDQRHYLRRFHQEQEKERMEGI